MKRSKTIHIINLNGYLEKNLFAQELLKHNMEMEPNMEWKIWTEKDPDIQKGLASYKGLAKDNITFLAGAYLPHYILYKYGGFYCEMDYELNLKNYFYKLYKSDCDFIYNSMRYITLNCNCGFVHYFPYPKNQFIKKALYLFNYRKRPLYLNCVYNDAETLYFSRAVKLKVLTKKEAVSLREEAYKKGISENLVLHHHRTYNNAKKIVFCKYSTFLQNKDNDLFKDDKNTLRMYLDTDPSIVPDFYDEGYKVFMTSDLEDFIPEYKISKKYFNDKTIVLDDDIKLRLEDKIILID